jgi:hypothetical protein
MLWKKVFILGLFLFLPMPRPIRPRISEFFAGRNDVRLSDADINLKMKINPLISIVVVIGVVTLFFFPEPESNFFAYLGTALFFWGLIVVLVNWRKRKK